MSSHDLSCFVALDHAAMSIGLLELVSVRNHDIIADGATGPHRLLQYAIRLLLVMHSLK